MATSRGTTHLSIPLALAAVAAGLALGVGAHAFHYAKGTSYLGNDPAQVKAAQLAIQTVSFAAAPPAPAVPAGAVPSPPGNRRCVAEVARALCARGRLPFDNWATLKITLDRRCVT